LAIARRKRKWELNLNFSEGGKRKNPSSTPAFGKEGRGGGASKWPYTGGNSRTMRKEPI